jgi:hypothetical protein
MQFKMYLVSPEKAADSIVTLEEERLIAEGHLFSLGR